MDPKVPSLLLEGTDWLLQPLLVMAMRLAIEFVAENCRCHAGRWWIPRTQQRGYS